MAEHTHTHTHSIKISVLVDSLKSHRVPWAFALCLSTVHMARISRNSLILQRKSIFIFSPRKTFYHCNYWSAVTHYCCASSRNLTMKDMCAVQKTGASSVFWKRAGGSPRLPSAHGPRFYFLTLAWNTQRRKRSADCLHTPKQSSVGII